MSTEIKNKKKMLKNEAVFFSKWNFDQLHWPCVNGEWGTKKSVSYYILSADPLWIRYTWCLNSTRSLIKTFSRYWVRITAHRSDTKNGPGTFEFLLVSSVVHKYLSPIQLNKVYTPVIISTSLGLWLDYDYFISI